MNIILIIAAIIAGIALIVVIYGFTRPQHSYMKREIEINSSAETVYEYANNLQKFVENWSPWTDKDPEMITTYNDISSGVGAKYEWKGQPKKVGHGLMEIIETDSNKKVKSLLQFGGRGDAFVTLEITPINDNKVLVAWDFTSDAGNNPIGRIFGSMMDKFLGPDFELGLRKLKETCEK
jgi:uncharacterized protein YndB with AHSA1/START domain